MGKEPHGMPTTFLDFGKTVAGHRTSYDYNEGQRAYDLYMGARYVFDVIAYRHGEIKDVFQPEDVRDQKRKYAALVALGATKSLVFYEVGSAVMGVIDALEYFNKTYRQLDIKRIKFIGVDNSRWMNEVASYTHEQYDVKLFDNVKKANHVKSDLFFAKGVSLMYAYTDEQAMCNTLKKSKLALFDYTFSLKGKIQNFVGTGVGVTFFDLEACKKILETDKKRILILKPYTIKTYHTDPNKVTYDCIYGEKDVVDKYLSELKRKTGESLKTYGDPKFIRKD